VVEPGNPDGLARTICEAASKRVELAGMGARARRLAEQRFDRRVATRRFAEVLNSLIKEEMPPRAEASLSPSTGAL
jgi:glycosyltransferase involved in cell wall biosynthesis